jgi:type IV pilus assembly protein PilV
MHMNFSQSGRNAGGSASVQASGGFSLLEVLIAIVILSIGMLGLAALQAYSLKTNESANFRTQATSLAYMIVDKMRANQTAVSQGQYLTGFSTVACPAVPRPAPVAAPTAAHDLAVWKTQIACQLPDGQGSITFPGPDADFPGGRAVVAIQWTDSQWAINPVDRQTVFQLVTSL